MLRVSLTVDVEDGFYWLICKLFLLFCREQNQFGCNGKFIICDFVSICSRMYSPGLVLSCVNAFCFCDPPLIPHRYFLFIMCTSIYLDTVCLMIGAAVVASN